MRSSIIVLISVLVVGSIIISLGFLTNQEYVEIPELSNQYENLEKYKNELEKINQYNQQILKELEDQFKNSDDIHLEQLNEEIEVIKRVINENKEELEQVIIKLSKIESEPWSDDYLALVNLRHNYIIFQVSIVRYGKRGVSLPSRKHCGIYHNSISLRQFLDRKIISNY